MDAGKGILYEKMVARRRGARGSMHWRGDDAAAIEERDTVHPLIVYWRYKYIPQA